MGCAAARAGRRFGHRRGLLDRVHARSRGAGCLRGDLARSHAGLGLWFVADRWRSFGGFEPSDRTDSPAVTEPRPLSWDALSAWRSCSSAVLCVRDAIAALWRVKVVSDGPIYHLYFAARWWKAGRLFLVAAPFGENAATYFPANGDLWFTWLMATWGGDRLAKVGQVPFLVLAGLAALRVCALLGAGRSASLVATCWFVSSTPLLLFSFEPNVDTIFVAGYLVAAYFFLRASSGEGDTRGLLSGSTGRGGGTGNQGRRGRLRSSAARSGARGDPGPACPGSNQDRSDARDLLGPLVSGGYWFIRNAL